MALSFPNQTRFYDAPRRAVQFWGHDSTMEAVFFVTEEALKQVQTRDAIRRARPAPGL
jgi:hypothetical protein